MIFDRKFDMMSGNGGSCHLPPPLNTMTVGAAIMSRAHSTDKEQQLAFRLAGDSAVPESPHASRIRRGWQTMLSQYLNCADCGATFQRRGPTNKYCQDCGDKRDYKRKRLWAKANPPTSCATTRRSS